MGREVERQATGRGHRCTAIIERARAAEAWAEALDGAEVAFEFTRAEAAEPNVAALVRAGVSVVCGTTGWEVSPRLAGILEGARAGALIAPNFSVGMQIFCRTVERAASDFGALGLHDPFIEEWHHRAKRDAPSGTARRLAAIVRQADARIDPGALPVVSLRAGVEPGTHRVGFDGEHDLVVLEHRARGRGGFALGAVLAAEWLRGRAGLQSFEDCVAAILRGELDPRGGGA
jgi:4-hydroxy-tetrahydrodipicolinate reductase